MMDLQVFSDDPNQSQFEQSSQGNGGTYWFASDLMRFLGYSSMQGFRGVLNKAMVACANLNIPPEENFIAISRDDGRRDTKLTRFACYLAAMNGHPSKPEVARAQAYFITIAESIRLYQEEVENVVRVELRGEITDREKSLGTVAHGAGVMNYPYFQNAGYRGMYNMNLSEMKTLRKIPSSRTPLDFMGPTELAANLFRITQTEEKIRAEGRMGQASLEDAAKSVGKEVRATMKRISGRAPEDLPVAKDIKTAKKEIKDTHKRLKRIDKKKKD